MEQEKGTGALKRLCYWSVTELLDGYSTQSVSPVQVIKDILDRIKQVNKRVNALCFVEQEDVLIREAKEAELRYKNGTNRLLEGIPVTVKDLLVVKGWVTRFGSKAIADSLISNQTPVDQHDSPPVERLREQGCIFVGKTTTPEFAWQGITRSALNGLTGNPFHTDYHAGGSSGGSSAAVALGIAPLSIGTDGAGSVRIPAAFCGISTIKPTFGRVPYSPPSAFGSLAHVGPMSRTIEDAALMMDVIGRPHLLDPFSILPSEADHPPQDKQYSKGLKLGVHGLKIAVSLTLDDYVPYVHPMIINAVKEAAMVFESLGAQVHFVDPPLKSFDIYKTFKTLWCTGAANRLKAFPNDMLPQFDPGLRQIAEEGNRLSAVDVAAAEFTRASMALAMNLFHEKYDVLITPTMPIPPFLGTHEVPQDVRFQSDPVAGSSSPAFEQNDRNRWWIWTPFTYPWNLTKQPAVAIPCGLGEDNNLDNTVYVNPFPISLQIIGPLYEDALVLRVAHSFQQATKHLQCGLDYINQQQL